MDPNEKFPFLCWLNLHCSLSSPRHLRFSGNAVVFIVNSFTTNYLYDHVVGDVYSGGGDNNDGLKATIHTQFPKPPSLLSPLLSSLLLLLIWRRKQKQQKQKWIYFFCCFCVEITIQIQNERNGWGSHVYV